MPRRRDRGGFARDTASSADRQAQEEEVAALLAPRETVTADWPIDRVDPNPYQPRRQFRDIDQLAAAISAQGFRSRLLVRPVPGAPGRVQLVYGERRLRAAKEAGLKAIPVEIGEYTDDEMQVIGLAENIQRQDLTPLEEAEAFRRMIDTQGYTDRSLAEWIGKYTGYVDDRLALLRAPTDVQQMVAERPDSLRAAREISKLPDPAEREPLIAGVVSGTLNTQDVRAKVQEAQSRPARSQAPQDIAPIAMPRTVVSVRLVAADRAALEAAVAQLSAGQDDRLQLVVSKAPGRKGDWLAYGTLRLADDDDDA